MQSGDVSVGVFVVVVCGWCQRLHIWHVMCIHPAYLIIKYLAYIPKLVAIFLSGTYLAATCEENVVVGGVLAYIHKIAGSVCQ